MIDKKIKELIKRSDTHILVIFEDFSTLEIESQDPITSLNFALYRPLNDII